ncbi:hypothetical protein K8R04_03710 [Candidatus Uhrbacteria bacterium]|nr:hypothetical protein [Candidatus Uhrbacteria bacterium]
MALKKSSKGKVSIPKYRWLMFWLLVLCSVALVCAIFGRVDVRTLNILNSEKTTVVTPPTEQKSDTKTRQVIRSPYNELNSEYPDLEIMSAPISVERPFERRVYEDKVNKFSLRVPYNPLWGIGRFVLEPYEQIQDYGSTLIVFGPLRVIPFEGCCIIARDFSFETRAPRSMRQIQDQEGAEYRVEIVTMGKHQVAKIISKCPDSTGMEDCPDEPYAFVEIRYEVLLDNVNLVFRHSPFIDNPEPSIKETIESITTK